MARKVAPKRVREPPSASSSSSTDEDEQLTDKEEEEEEEEEEVEEEEEEKQVNKDKPSAVKPNPTTPTTKTTEPNSSSDSESGSDSDTHSGQTQPSPNASDFTIKPIASKPTNGSPKPKKPASKPVAKRPLEKTKNANESKKKKTKVEEEEKKYGGAITRLWSEDDEVVILKSMIEFQSKYGIDPYYSDIVGFHKFIKKSLSVEVSTAQLKDKVRRLKQKYEKKASKGEKGAVFGLSKKIWGGGGKESSGVVGSGSGSGNGNGNRKSKTARKNVKVDDSLAFPKENGKGVVMVEGVKGERNDVKVDKVEEFWSMYPCLKQSLVTKMEEPVKSFMMGNTSAIGNVKAKEMEKKWESLCLDEAALYLRRVELIQEQTKLVVDAMKASKD